MTTSCRIEEDTSFPGGYALIHVTGVLPLGEKGFSIERPGSDKPYLGLTGWQTQAVLLQAFDVIISESSSTLKVGPDVVDYINEDWRVTVRVQALDFVQSVFWPPITPSGRTQRTVAVSPMEQVELLRKLEREKKQAAAQAAKAQASIEAVPFSSIEKEPVALPSQNKMPLIAGILVALMICGGGAYWWFKMRGGETPAAAVARGPERATEPTPSPNPAPTSEQTNPAPAAPRVDWRGDLQRLTQNGSPVDIYDFGRRSMEAGERETGYLAIDIAQQRGYGEAILQIGRWYDPRYHANERMFSRPNIEQAGRYYKRAFEAGLSAGVEELRGLCSSVRRDPPSEPDEQENARLFLSTYCS